MGPNVDQIDRRIIIEELLDGIEHRGKEATGIGWWGEPSDETTRERFPLLPIVYKQPISATAFVKQSAELLRQAVTSDLVIAHTRYPTQGHKSKPENNHPIDHEWVVGVHNGMVANDFELFRELGIERKGEVDSEAIFAVVSHEIQGTKPGTPERMSAIAEALEEVRGSMAIAFYIKDEPLVLYLAKGSGSPLWVAQSELDDLMFASTKEAIDDTIDSKVWLQKYKFGPAESVTEGTLLRIGADGEADMHTFSTRRPVHTTHYGSRGWGDFDYYDSGRTHTAPRRDPNPTLAFSNLDHVYKQQHKWLNVDTDVEFTEGQEAILANTELWDQLMVDGLDWFVGLWDSYDQMNVLHLLASHLFARPSLKKDRVIDLRHMQFVVNGAIHAVAAVLSNPANKTTMDSIANKNYKDLATTIPFDTVEWRHSSGGQTEWLKSWLVCHIDGLGKYPNHKVLVACPDTTGAVALRLLSSWQVRPMNDEPDAEHKMRLAYIEDLAYEMVYCESNDLPFEMPYLDFEDLPKVMHTAPDPKPETAAAPDDVPLADLVDTVQADLDELEAEITSMLGVDNALDNLTLPDGSLDDMASLFDDDDPANWSVEQVSQYLSIVHGIDIEPTDLANRMLGPGDTASFQPVEQQGD